MNKLFAILSAGFMMMILSACSHKVHQLDETYNGKTIDCSPDDVIEVRLPGNPTTGYQWMQTQQPSDQVLVLTKEDFELVNSDRKMVGVPGTYYFRYVVSGKGNEGIRLQYRRSWEKNQEPAGRFDVLVRSK